MKLFLSLASVICFCSCTHVYYAPSSANTPLFREKNEGMVNAAFIGSDETSGVQVQSAYAVGKNVGVQLNFMTMGESNNTSYNNQNVKEKGRGTYIEAAAGYFTPFTNRKFVFETYGGIGGGVINNHYASSESSKVGLTKLFLQPAIGLRLPNYQMSIATKFSAAMLRIKSSDLSGSGLPLEYAQLYYINDHKTSFLLEPTLTFRGGLKGVMLQAQITFSLNLNNNNLPQEDDLFSLGIIIPFKARSAASSKGK
jgi:hypothetical protein